MKTLFYSKKRFLLSLSLLFIVLMVLIAFLHEDGLLSVYRTDMELSGLKIANEQLRIKNDQLNIEIQALKTDPAGIEAIAREKLNLVKPGELIFRIIPKTTSTDFSKNAAE